MKKAIILLVVALLAGCAVGPDYKRPAIDIPQNWRFEDKEAKDVANTAWWQQFNDPVLNELIQIALRENKDLKVAVARIGEFVGQYVTTRASLFPQFGVGASGGVQRITKTGLPALPPGTENTDDVWSVFVNGSWEIDIWGKIRRATEAARAGILSSEEGRRAVILSLVAAVASAYIDLRDADMEMEISIKTADAYRESLHIFELRFKEGFSSSIEVNMVKAEYERALAAIFFYEKTIPQLENALSILLGRNPGPIPRGRTLDGLALPDVPAGLPSGLLEQRPDIRGAEQDLIAANAQIGAAKALYYPAISLTAAFGYSSADLSKLFKSPAQAWSVAAPVIAPIFTAGAIRGQVKFAESRQQELVVRYQQAIQSAFREVDDALVDQKQTKPQLEALGRRTEALREYARLAQLRFDNGYTSYLEVLDANRSLFDAELNYAQTKATLFRSFVNLYKAMGGGWVTEADKMTGEDIAKESSTKGYLIPP
ncbi:MAG TPA: efflux transporter outer membrane subunit [Syntrophobacteraceae bacterium]|nr:efflux transporter outer membrane subunit [Syntrophobacteraceae bacterium]